ncbi:MAG: helix-turn-helix transcriptional regulator [Verrucomicrobiae bacterium]|nr:helix-turn-helix transcriptional regulator [Verrucomicrobiae bacterium]
MPRRFRNVIGPAVRRLRTERGLTQDQLAARLVMAGIQNADRVWVAKVESRIRSVFDFELAVVAGVLGTKPDRLLPELDVLKTDLQALQEGKR